MAPDTDTVLRPALASTTDDKGVTATFVDAVMEALTAGHLGAVRTYCTSLRPADLADLLELVDRDQRRELVQVLGRELGAETLSELEEGVRDEVLDILDPVDVAAAIEELDSDDGVYLIENLDPGKRREILDAVPAVDREAVEKSLQYPEDSAGRLMKREVIGVPAYWTVGQVIDYTRETRDLPDEFYELYAVDPAFRPVGTVALSEMLRSPRTTLIEEISDPDIDLIPAEMDQEDVAYRFEQYSLVSAPVIDKHGRLIGVVTVDDVIGVITEEAEEDIKRMAGVGQESEITDSVLTTTRYRFPWLFINLLTAIAASAVIALYDGVIEHVVALAVLMPIVASMGGNAGTQALTVAVRALATKEITPTNARRIVFRETMVGLLNGLGFAIIMGLAGGWWTGSVAIGLVLAAAMLVNHLVAGMAGILIPLALDKFKLDPAVSASVFVTTVTDVIGFFAFLGLAAAVLL